MSPAGLRLLVNLRRTLDDLTDPTAAKEFSTPRRNRCGANRFHRDRTIMNASERNLYSGEPVHRSWDATSPRAWIFWTAGL